MTEHSRFGGSSAPRYLECPGSVALVAQCPPQPTSKYAQEGTDAHELAAKCLMEGDRDASVYIGSTVESGAVVTQEMCDAVQVYLDAVYSECDSDDAHELYVEKRFSFSTPSAEDGEVFGANDALVYKPSSKKLVVFDYKHGQGVSVSADDNAQLKFYAAGAALSHTDWPVDEIELVIVQPRANDVDYAGAVRRWPIDPADLLDFAGELDATIALAKQPDAPLKVGPHCKKTFCPAFAICPAHEKAALADLAMDYQSVEDISAMSLPDIRKIDPARFPAIKKAIGILAEWGNQIDQYGYSELLAGRPFPGYKLVEKVGRRKWIEAEEEIAAFLSLQFDISEDDVRPRKLVTITEAERLLKAHGGNKEAKDELSLHYTVKESSGVTMAPESDRRPAVDAVAADFGSVDMTALTE